MPSALPRNIILSNGVELPAVGLGTFKATGADVKAAAHAALKHGIRHIDTAAIYKNEAAIGEALRESGLPRSSVFITSKVSPYQQGTEKARVAVQEILERLGTDYVDLLLIHWPGMAKADSTSPLNAQLRWETWRVLEDMYGKGAARAIGVSNYEARHVRELVDRAAVRPMVNQFEMHPRRQMFELRQACAAAGVAVVAYSSLGCGELLTKPEVLRVAQRVERTPAQVLLRWALQQGVAVIPKSIRPERVAEFDEGRLLGSDWGLSAEDMAALGALEDGHKYCWDPSPVL